MLLVGGRASSRKEARRLAERTLDSGAGLTRFGELIEAQGGSRKVTDDPDIMGRARWVEETVAPHSGYIARLDARQVGLAAVELGAGRRAKGAQVDPVVGLVFAHKVGDYVAQGETLFVVHANDSQLLAKARELVLGAYHWSEVPLAPPRHLYGIMQ